MKPSTLSLGLLAASAVFAVVALLTKNPKPMGLCYFLAMLAYAYK